MSYTRQRELAISEYVTKIMKTLREKHERIRAGGQQNFPGSSAKEKELAHVKTNTDAELVTSEDVNITGNVIRKRILKESSTLSW